MANQTYAALKKQREILEKLIEKTKNKEQRGIVKRMQEAIKFYGLTAVDLGFKDLNHTLKTDGKTSSPVLEKANGAERPHPNKGVPKPIRYRHGDDSWSGSGYTPNWLKTLIDEGHDKEEFRVNEIKPRRKSMAIAQKSAAQPSRRAGVIPGATYRSATGKEWNGTGSMPSWLQFQIHKAGRKVDDFLVKEPKRAKPSASPQPQPELETTTS